MKIIEVKSLSIPEVKVIKFGRFPDNRGYFTEHFRKSDFQKNSEVDFLKQVDFVQCNESFSKTGVIRGLHFQWNPCMGKLVRTIKGRLVDLALDIRKGSPTLGKIIAYDLPCNENNDFSEWIWIPPGFAHGTLFPEDSVIEYFCSGEYSPNCEAGISPLAQDFDWSLCDSELKNLFDQIAPKTQLLTDKDLNGFSLKDWLNDPRSENFAITELPQSSDQKKNDILVTGGSGLLGSALKKLIPKGDFPTSSNFDLNNFKQMDDYLSHSNCKIVIHAAAFTSPPKIDQDPLKAIETNIIGTGNLTKLCMKYKIKLVYICTDYVFKGDKGNYSEEDPVLPVNKYSWSKLGGECAVRMYDNSLIIRTSFGPSPFPYEKAFVDQWTSRESAEIIAGKIVDLLDKDITGVVHVGGERKTVFEYAKQLSAGREIGRLSRNEVNFSTPVDTSLNCEKYRNLLNQIK